LASFDLPVQGGSFATDLARRGFDVYVMDVRGYGRSTRPKEMQEPPDAHAPLVRSNDAVRDLSAVVDAIRRRRRVARVALFGWATGGQWAGYYACLYPGTVSALILRNSLYRGSSQQALIGRGTDSEDPVHPRQFNQASCRGYRYNDTPSLLRPWNHSIPMKDKSEWRDPAVARAYVDAAIASDPVSRSQRPTSFRSLRSDGRQFLPCYRKTTLGCVSCYCAHLGGGIREGFLVTFRGPGTSCRRPCSFAKSTGCCHSRCNPFCPS
jgi:alpha-beta hydrolase superfamily lysophospholipase